jgi:gamma-glutamyltranspeptidase/glutathione hydrolase
MVVSQERLASQAGAQVLREGGTTVDAVVATAFVLAVTHPIAGNIGGGGFMVLGAADGHSEVIDFREMAPRRAHPRMFMRDGHYDEALHHESHLSVGVPGTVSGLHLAWKRHGKLPWRRLLEPAIRAARDGFPVSGTLADSLKEFLPDLQKYPATLAQFTRGGIPYETGETLRQPDLARTLERIAERGPRDFYRGETARLLVKEMQTHGGLITRKDLAAYRPVVRRPLMGSYRGFQVITVPPPSGGGIALLSMLNQLEGFDVRALGQQPAQLLHLEAEAMRRAFADRARWIGDPAFNAAIPVRRLTSKVYAESLRGTIDPARASLSSPERFTWTPEKEETTHVSAADAAGNAVSLTYTLEDNYGSRILVPGAGFLLNNEMGDFNGEPGRTDATGLIGTKPNLAAPGKRMLSSMAPTILTRGGKLFLVTGSPGGRTIPNTVLQTILNVVDFGMDAQAAVDAPRIHHQWLPDRISVEKGRLDPALVAALKAKGHTIHERSRTGVAQVIHVRPDGSLDGGADRLRWAESFVAGN